MDQITEQIFIGNYVDAQDASLLLQLQIGAVLCLDGGLSVESTNELNGIEIVSVPLIDGPGNDIRDFRYCISELRRLVAAHPRVLVHCHAGRSRSPSIVAGYLVYTLGVDSDSALAAIQEKRDICVAPALVRLLYQLED